MQNRRFPLQGGVNNNNFNRSNVPSNRYPPTGYQNNNPFGNFTPNSTNQQRVNQEQWHNFNQSFAVPQNILQRPDFTNYGEVVHNNIGEQVMDEHVVEYRINIDSTDRDISAFPDPFSYRVTFAPPSGRIIRKSSGRILTADEKYNGPPEPHILIDFENVKYIKLDSIIVPIYTKLEDTGGGVWAIDTSDESAIHDDRFIMLKVKEFENEFTYGTNIASTKSFAQVIPDKLIGTKHCLGYPYYGSKTFKNSDLGNVHQMTFEFCDSRGNKIAIDGLDSTVTDETDVRHPLYDAHQNHISLVIGVVEAQINNNTKFDN